MVLLLGAWRRVGDVHKVDYSKGFVGKTLANKYVLQKPIGSGGMGSVYRGVQLGTRGRVAVKLLSKQAPDDTIISRFRQKLKYDGTVDTQILFACWILG